MDARAALLRLQAELAERGWKAELRGTDDKPVLYVRNPSVAALNEEIHFASGGFRWPHGQGIGPAEDVRGVAGAIIHVLRAVGEGTEAGS